MMLCGLLLLLYLPITSLAYDRGLRRHTVVDYFSPQPIATHPDRALVAENAALRARVEELEAQVVREARTYLDLIADREQLRHKLERTERLRAKWHRLYRTYRNDFIRRSVVRNGGVQVG
jgi:hypothetical protein